MAQSKKIPPHSAATIEAHVLEALQRLGKALSKSDIVAALAETGVDVGSRWDTVQKRLKANRNITLEKDGIVYRYLWKAESLSPAEAFERILQGRLAKAEKDSLAEVVRAALAAEPADDDRAARRLRQANMEAARALAEAAMEVEELVAKGASARGIIHTVRTRMKRLRLEAIDRAGEQVAFDRHRHQPIGPDIADGTPVLVVRPGYVWKTPAKDVLIERPIVQD